MIEEEFPEKIILENTFNDFNIKLGEKIIQNKEDSVDILDYDCTDISLKAYLM